ncbi:MAG: polyphosphate kinase [Alphaproteobacteria bacterium]|tara:strand:- start:627 stop:1490 length:864 start_codon:yes stop_codon:yes gene_type:complete
MKLREVKAIETPYAGIDTIAYTNEKKRLQVELLNIQQRIIEEKRRLVVIFEGRDAAGKGSTIKRFTENLIPKHFKTVELGIPTKHESKNWFQRYERHFPNPGEITFFDRSWYTRALIEPTLHYCSNRKYQNFMNKVLTWEHNHIANGLILIKYYLSVDPETQLYRLENRINDPLSYWKISDTDIRARKEWHAFTEYKKQMFKHTSSKISPWVVINGNEKREARLTSMLYLVRKLAGKEYVPLTGDDIKANHSIKVNGVKFRGLTLQQFSVLQELRDNKELFSDLKNK